MGPCPYELAQRAVNAASGGEHSGPGEAARAWEHAAMWHRNAQIEHAANELLLSKLVAAEAALRDAREEAADVRIRAESGETVRQSDWNELNRRAEQDPTRARKQALAEACAVLRTRAEQCKGLAEDERARPGNDPEFRRSMRSRETELSFAIKEIEALSAQPVPDGFYILSPKHSHGKDWMLWWRPNNQGYTLFLENAGLYPREDVEANPDYYNNGNISFAIPAMDVRSAARSTVYADQARRWLDEARALEQSRAGRRVAQAQEGAQA